MRNGILFYDCQQKRYDIRFNDEDFYGGLHCGDCFDVYYNDDWKETRIEYSDDWYLVGFSRYANHSEIDGLKVRL